MLQGLRIPGSRRKIFVLQCLNQSTAGTVSIKKKVSQFLEFIKSLDCFLIKIQPDLLSLSLHTRIVVVKCHREIP